MTFLSLFTKLLHILPPEVSHTIGLTSLKFLYKLRILNFLINSNKHKRHIKNTSTPDETNFLNKFPNKIGLAAGLDKNGDFIDELSSLKIGFLEIGTVTPKPQKGNNKPRLYRDKKNLALINRMGFNNKGVDYLVTKVQQRRSLIPLGISIGKNFDTPINEAYKDYLICMEKVYKYSDYIAVNISSPNTKDLRDLSSSNYLDDLLKKLKSLQGEKSKKYGYKPLFVKISPDEDQDGIIGICNSIKKNSIDGIICTNTSVNHSGKNGKGGISGAPLLRPSTDIQKSIRALMGKEFPIIASGGVMNAADYKDKINCGADLVQIYTGFIYNGPKLITDILEH